VSRRLMETSTSTRLAITSGVRIDKMEKWRKVRPLVIPWLVAASIAAITLGLLNLGDHLELTRALVPFAYIAFILGYISPIIIPSIFIITYGYKTEDRLTSIYTGILTYLLLLFSYVLFEVWGCGLPLYTNSLGWLWFSTSTAVFGTIGAFEGHFAARKKLRPAITLGALWSVLLFFMFYYVLFGAVFDIVFCYGTVGSFLG